MRPPTPEDFQKAIEAFWMDAFHVTKYLWRGELWRSKHYDWQLKQHLLQMMGWHSLVCRGQEHFTTYEGKQIQKWVDPDTYIGLMTVFGRFYPADSWRALEETIKNFTRLSEALADALKTDDRQALKEQFFAWLEDLRANPDGM